MVAELAICLCCSLKRRGQRPHSQCPSSAKASPLHLPPLWPAMLCHGSHGHEPWPKAPPRASSRLSGFPGGAGLHVPVPQAASKWLHPALLRMEVQHRHHCELDAPAIDACSLVLLQLSQEPGRTVQGSARLLIVAAAVPVHALPELLDLNGQLASMVTIVQDMISRGR